MNRQMIRHRAKLAPAAVALLLASIGSTTLAAQSAADRTPAVTAVSAGTVGPNAAPKRAAGMPAEITIQREVFDYNSSGRRDPYHSLMSTSDVRPLLSDLRLTAVAFDPDGDNSVAILRDSFSKAQYRIRVGQQLGRLRVSGIKQKSVQFTLDEFGFNRQETLQLSSDTTKLRNP